MLYTDLTKSAENWQGKFPELNMLRFNFPIPSGMPPPKRPKTAPPWDRRCSQSMVL